MLFWTCYILYALSQAILTCRYLIELKPSDSPAGVVAIMSIFAPLVSAGLCIYGFVAAVNWLVTYRSPTK